jgi:hypothetical protein
VIFSYAKLENNFILERGKKEIMVPRTIIMEDFDDG